MHRVVSAHDESDGLVPAQLRAGKMTINAVKTDMRQLAQLCVRGVSSWADGTVTLETDADVPPTLLVDPLRMKQIIDNGLSNAAKQGSGPILMRQRVDRKTIDGVADCEVYSC